jgi:hypothetical protein
MDAGTRAVEWLFTEGLKVDRHWAVRTEAGFRWWADKQEQTIEVVGREDGVPDGAAGCLIRVRTDLLRDVVLAEEGLPAINSEIMSFASMAGLVYDEDARTLSLSSLARVCDDNEEWLDPFLGMAALVQIGEVRMLAPQLAQRLGAEVAFSGHPDHGLRAHPDEVAQALRALVIPAGERPSDWQLEPIEDELREYVGGPVTIAPAPDGAGLDVELPFGDVTSRCQIMPAAQHPLYGSGLLVLQEFPLTSPVGQSGARLALVLNEIELAREPLGFGFGSYAWRDELMHFVSFLPNTLYRPGLLADLILSCAQRSRGLSTVLEQAD